jgi:hypothetical protein
MLEQQEDAANGTQLTELQTPAHRAKRRHKSETTENTVTQSINTIGMSTLPEIRRPREADIHTSDVAKEKLLRMFRQRTQIDDRHQKKYHIHRKIQ